MVAVFVDAGPRDEAERPVELRVHLGFHGPVLGDRVELIVGEHPILRDRLPATAQDARGRVVEVAAIGAPFRPGAPGRPRRRPDSPGIEGRWLEHLPDVHPVVLLRQVFAVPARAGQAGLHTVELELDAERPDLLLVVEHRFEVRVRLPEAVDPGSGNVGQTHSAVAEGKRPGAAAEDARRRGAEVGRVPPEPVRRAAGGRQGIALADLVGDSRPVVALLEAAVEPPRVGPVAQPPFERSPQRTDVPAVDVLVDARQGIAAGILHAVGEVLDVAVAIELVAGEPECDRVAERQVQRGLAAVVVVVPGFEVDEAGDLAHFRLAGDEIDGAAGGIAAEQRSLGSAQDLDAFHVEELQRVQVGAADGDFVQVGGYAGLGGASDHEAADAPDAEARAAEVGCRERHVGGVELQVGRVDHLTVVENIAGQRGHGDRHIGQALRDALRGDDHFFDRRLAGFLGRDGEARRRQRNHRCQGEQAPFGALAEDFNHSTLSPIHRVVARSDSGFPAQFPQTTGHRRHEPVADLVNPVTALFTLR